MTIDMTNNRVPYGLLTDEEKAALHEHEKAGGEFEYWCGTWEKVEPTWFNNMTYRTVPLPKTQDVIAWDRLPDWVEWVARDENGEVHAYDAPDCDPEGTQWVTNGGDFRRIDDFPGIVQVGTCNWNESKQRRPK